MTDPTPAVDPTPLPAHATPGQTAVIAQTGHPDRRILVTCTRRGIWAAADAAGTPAQWQATGWRFERLLPVAHDRPAAGR